MSAGRLSREAPFAAVLGSSHSEINHAAFVFSGPHMAILMETGLSLVEGHGLQCCSLQNSGCVLKVCKRLRKHPCLEGLPQRPEWTYSGNYEAAEQDMEYIVAPHIIRCYLEGDQDVGHPPIRFEVGLLGSGDLLQAEARLRDLVPA